MNTLLTNGEVPGLFEGDEYITQQYNDPVQRSRTTRGSYALCWIWRKKEELFKWFAQQVMRKLHVVFTMNPSSEGLKDRASTCQALFNHCALNWLGDWTGELIVWIFRICNDTNCLWYRRFRSPHSSKWVNNWPTITKWTWRNRIGFQVTSCVPSFDFAAHSPLIVTRLLTPLFVLLYVHQT